MSGAVLRVARMQLVASARVYFETLDRAGGSGVPEENDAVSEAVEVAWQGLERAVVAYADYLGEHVAEQAREQAKAERAKARKPRTKKKRLQLVDALNEAHEAGLLPTNGAAEHAES